MNLKNLNLVSSSDQKKILNFNCTVKDDSAIIRNGNFIFVMGGFIYDEFMIYPFFVLDYVENVCIPVSITEELILSGQSLVHFQNSIYVFGGAGFKINYRSQLKIYNNIYKLSFENTDIFSIPCSEGTSVPHCSMCLKGTYSLSGKCIKCPEGTFNTKVGSASIEQCIPCPYQTFNDKQGSSLCFDCPKSQICPIGSIKPKSHIKILSNSTIQPSQYEPDKPYISSLTSIIWYSFCIALSIFLLIIFLSRKSFIYLQKLDIFSSSYPKEFKKPVVLRKTKLGGLFSLSFLISCCVILILSILNFKLDNFIEIRGTVPVVVLKEKVAAEILEINFTLYTYGGLCVDSGKCKEEILHEVKGLNYTKEEKNCYAENDNCQVVIKFFGLNLKLKQAEVMLSLKEPGSYASALSVNVSVSSSIPGEISSVFTSIETPSDNMVLKGMKPNILYYKFMPSVKFI